MYCGTPNSVAATVFSRYFHFFWIPVIPLGKFSVTQCQHCKQVLEKKEMPATYQAPVAAVQHSARLPVTNYLVLLLMGALVLFMLGVGLFRKDTEPAAAVAPAPAAPLAEEAPAALPAVGAVFLMPMAAGRYSLMQVTRTTPDSAYFRITDPLTGGPGAAKITSALRDSVAPANQAMAWSRQQWQTVRQHNKEFIRLR
ncbi:zinc ribbon domain-containing protein [Hymenobacter chitinivorans]|nr:hypothetical protein [Hymenobacter chitinivorans]